MSEIKGYYTGGPMWANKNWQGVFFTRKAKPVTYLKQYASVWNSVEGNTTFYSLPKKEIVQRWRSDTPDNFRFTFKMSKTITHIYKLRHVQKELTSFFYCIEHIQDKMGLVFIQLPPSFNKSGFATLETFIQTLPKDYNYAIECRHLDFFDEDKNEKRLIDLLEKYQLNRAIFLTSVLHQIESSHEGILAAQKKKPRMPDRFTITGQQPLIRYCGYPNVEKNIPFMTKLAHHTAGWINKGLKPYIFLHSPDGDFHVPHLCRAFHQLVGEALDKNKTLIGQIEKWPADKEKQLPKQGKLF